MDRGTLLAIIREHRDEFVALTRDLVRFKTENPPGDMTEIANFVETYFRDCGVSVQRYEPKKGRVSLVATVKGAGDRALAFNGHLDVVPAGSPSAWQVDPYGAEVIDGKIWGRGAADMKSKVAVAMVLSRILQKLGMPFPGTWTVMLVPDEETGGEDGTRWLIDQGLVRPDAVIVGEGAGSHYGVANKGSLGVNLKAKGRSAHAARPFEGVNAIEMLASVLSRIHDLEIWEPALPPDVQEIIELSRPFYEQNAHHRNVPVERYIWSLSHTTVNMGLFRGGSKRNVVADSAVVELDIRYPPGLTGSTVEARLKELLNNLPVAGLSMEVVFDFEPFHQGVNTEIVQISKEAIRDLGICSNPCPIFKGSFNDCRHLHRAGIPSVVLGHEGSGGHIPNENCTIDEVMQTARLYGAVILEFLQKETVGGGH